MKQLCLPFLWCIVHTSLGLHDFPYLKSGDKKLELTAISHQNQVLFIKLFNHP